MWRVSRMLLLNLRKYKLGLTYVENLWLLDSSSYASFFFFPLSPPPIQPSSTLCTATRPQIARFPHPVLFIHLLHNSGSALKSPLGVSNPSGTAKRGGGIGEWDLSHEGNEEDGRKTRNNQSGKQSHLPFPRWREGLLTVSSPLSPMSPPSHWRGS